MGQKKYRKTISRAAGDIRNLAFLCLFLLSSNAFTYAQSIAQNAIPDGASNTLLTGVVVDRLGQPVPELIEVIVSTCKGTQTTRLLAHGGLFSHDFTHELAPTERIRIEVIPGPQHSSSVAAPNNEDSIEAAAVHPVTTIVVSPATWSGARKEVRLQDAQNITVMVDYFRPYLDNYHIVATSGMVLPPEWRINPQAMPFPMTVPTPCIRIHKPPKPQDRSCTDR